METCNNLSIKFSGIKKINQNSNVSQPNAHTAPKTQFASTQANALNQMAVYNKAGIHFKGNEERISKLIIACEKHLAKNATPDKYCTSLQFINNLISKKTQYSKEILEKTFNLAVTVLKKNPTNDDICLHSLETIKKIAIKSPEHVELGFRILKTLTEHNNPLAMVNLTELAMKKEEYAKQCINIFKPKINIENPRAIYACQSLGVKHESVAQDALDAIKPILKQKDPDGIYESALIRIYAYTEIGNTHPKLTKQVVDALTPLAKDRDEHAVKALGELGSKNKNVAQETFDTLITLINEDIEEIGHLINPEMQEAMPLVETDIPDVSQQAIRGIGKIGSKQEDLSRPAFNKLTSLISESGTDPDAMIALGEVGGSHKELSKPALNAIKTYLNDEEESVQKAAIKGAGYIARGQKELTREILDQITPLITNPNENVSATAIKTCGKIAKAQKTFTREILDITTPLITNPNANPNQKISDSAIKTLRKIGLAHPEHSKEIIDKLILPAIMRENENPTVAEIAHNAIKAIGDIGLVHDQGAEIKDTLEFLNTKGSLFHLKQINAKENMTKLLLKPLDEILGLDSTTEIMNNLNSREFYTAPLNVEALTQTPETRVLTPTSPPAEGLALESLTLDESLERPTKRPRID